MNALQNAADMLQSVRSLAMSPAVGYKLHRRGWSEADLATDMTGKVCVITGGSSGLGLAAAKGIAIRGAEVVLICRDAERGAEACRIIKNACGHDRVHLELCDIACQQSVRALAERLTRSAGRIDVLIHNVGTLVKTCQMSRDKVEMTFAINVLGGFLLTRLLIPYLRAVAPSRIIHVTSGLMYTQRLDVAELVSPSSSRYNEMLRYAQTKRALAMLSQIWAERLAKTGVMSSCVNPGLALTPGTTRLFPHYSRLIGPFLRTPEEGADTVIWLALSRAASGQTGKLWFDRRSIPLDAVPWTRSPRSDALRLWSVCSDLTGLADEID